MNSPNIYISKAIFNHPNNSSRDVLSKIAVFIIAFALINSFILLNMTEIIGINSIIHILSVILFALNFIFSILMFFKIDLKILANASIVAISIIYIPIMWIFSGGLHGTAPLIMFMLIIFNTILNSGFFRTTVAIIQFSLITSLLYYGYVNPSAFDNSISSQGDIGIILNMLYIFIATAMIVYFFVEQNKQTIKEVEEANQKLLEANKEVAEAARTQRELISNLSHDLNTPITLISGYAAALKEGLVSEDKYDKYLALIERKSLDLSYLIDDLIELANLETALIKLDQKPYKLSVLLKELEMQYSDEIKESHLDFVIESTNKQNQDFYVAIDKRQVQKVFNNLVYNALKHTEQGYIKISLSLADESAIFEVSDTGTGIKDDQLPYIFDRFYKGSISRNSEKVGSGLGLHISKKIVQLHGGDIWAENKKRQGANFFFSLPLYHKED